MMAREGRTRFRYWPVALRLSGTLVGFFAPFSCFNRARAYPTEVCRDGQGGSDRLLGGPSPSASKVRMVIPGVLLGCARYMRGVPCRPRRADRLFSQPVASASQVCI
jgi:hypothetical protein